MNETMDRVIEFVTQRFKMDARQIKPEDDFFETLGINSLQALDLLGDLELEFHVMIPDYVLKEVTTFDGLASVIERFKCA